MEPDPHSDPRWASQRLAAVGSIAALVGHAARNRLTVVRAALELIEVGAGGELTAEQGTAFLGELDRFLGDFNLGLEMIRCQDSGTDSVSVRQIVAEALARCRLSAERAGIALQFFDQDGGDLVSADPLLLRQSLLNLLRNSIEALTSAGGGRIVVRSVAGDLWRIEVADNGPGLPPDMLENAREDGFVFPSGSGLGLILCRDAMTLMGGKLSYEPPLSQRGACFRLSLPRARS